MIETNGKMSVGSVINKQAKVIALKFHSRFLPLLKERIAQAEASGKGLNILMYGDLFFDISLINSPKGEEYKVNITNNSDSIGIASWNPDLAYNGSHLFWAEAIIDKVHFENGENLKNDGFWKPIGEKAK